MNKLVILGAVWMALGAAGPFSKFSEKPARTFQVSAKLEDVERCLLDLDKVMAPSVYTQPDRPDVVNLLYSAGEGVSIGRVELTRDPAGTSIKAWMPFKQADACFR